MSKKHKALRGEEIVIWDGKICQIVEKTADKIWSIKELGSGRGIHWVKAVELIDFKMFISTYLNDK